MNKNIALGVLFGILIATCIYSFIPPKQIDQQETIIRENTISTVGSNGEFKTMNEAISYLSQCYPMYKNGGINVQIKILSGTIIKEQIAIKQIDLSYITIVAEDERVNVDASNFVINGLDAHDLRGDVALFGGENGARLPTIGCIFHLQTANSTYGVVGYFANRGSEGVVLSNSGFDSFNDGVIANNESLIIIREGVCTNCTRWGVHARHNGEVSARSCDLRGSGNLIYGAAEADRIADIDVRAAIFSGDAVAIVAQNTSRINSNGAYVQNVTEAIYSLVQSHTGSIVNGTGMSFINCASNYLFLNIEGGIITATESSLVLINVTSITYARGKNILSSSGIIFG